MIQNQYQVMFLELLQQVFFFLLLNFDEYGNLPVDVHELHSLLRTLSEEIAQNNMEWLEITSMTVEQLENEAIFDTWTIDVENEDGYFANGVVAHNVVDEIGDGGGGVLFFLPLVVPLGEHVLKRFPKPNKSDADAALFCCCISCGSLSGNNSYLTESLLSFSLTSSFTSSTPGGGDSIDGHSASSHAARNKRVVVNYRAS